MDYRILMNTDIALDFLTKNGEKTKEAQMVIRESLRGRYELLVTSETVSEINRLMLESGMTVGQAKECLSTLLNLISVIDTTEDDCQRALSQESDVDFDDAMIAESALRNQCVAIVTRSKKMFNQLGLNYFSPKEFLALGI
ncbi:MAG: PIN domain-containing protein [Streptococcaceae bacterium]|jgi:predicted nucleic acid-binding protein|nr:PIN domain-containing protein [Streptococcaceae bacterium]